MTDTVLPLIRKALELGLDKITHAMITLRHLSAGREMSQMMAKDLEVLGEEASVVSRAMVALDTLDATEPVPPGTYLTRHGDGIISYSEGGQLSVSQRKVKMTVFVGTLPEGWELRRPKKVTTP